MAALATTAEAAANGEPCIDVVGGDASVPLDISDGIVVRNSTTEDQQVTLVLYDVTTGSLTRDSSEQTVTVAPGLHRLATSELLTDFAFRPHHGILRVVTDACKELVLQAMFTKANPIRIMGEANGQAALGSSLLVVNDAPDRIDGTLHIAETRDSTDQTVLDRMSVRWSLDPGLNRLLLSDVLHPGLGEFTTWLKYEDDSAGSPVVLAKALATFSTNPRVTFSNADTALLELDESVTVTNHTSQARTVKLHLTWQSESRGPVEHQLQPGENALELEDLAASLPFGSHNVVLAVTEDSTVLDAVSATLDYPFVTIAGADAGTIDGSNGVTLTYRGRQPLPLLVCLRDVAEGDTEIPDLGLEGDETTDADADGACTEVVTIARGTSLVSLAEITDTLDRLDWGNRIRSWIGGSYTYTGVLELRESIDGDPGEVMALVEISGASELRRGVEWTLANPWIGVAALGAILWVAWALFRLFGWCYNRLACRPPRVGGLGFDVSAPKSVTEGDQEVIRAHFHRQLDEAGASLGAPYPNDQTVPAVSSVMSLIPGPDAATFIKTLGQVLTSLRPERRKKVQIVISKFGTNDDNTYTINMTLRGRFLKKRSRVTCGSPEDAGREAAWWTYGQLATLLFIGKSTAKRIRFNDAESYVDLRRALDVLNKYETAEAVQRLVALSVREPQNAQIALWCGTALTRQAAENPATEATDFVQAADRFYQLWRSQKDRWAEKWGFPSPKRCRAALTTSQYRLAAAITYAVKAGASRQPLWGNGWELDGLAERPEDPAARRDWWLESAELLYRELNTPSANVAANVTLQARVPPRGAPAEVEAYLLSHPTDAGVVYNAAAFYSSRGDAVRAVKHLRRVVNLPDWTTSHTYWMYRDPDLKAARSNSAWYLWDTKPADPSR